MIQDAEQQTRKDSIPVMQQIAKAFNEANSIIDNLTPGNWQTMLMERYTEGPKKENLLVCLGLPLIEVSLNRIRKTLKKSSIKNGRISMGISTTKILLLEKL